MTPINLFVVSVFALAAIFVAYAAAYQISLDASSLSNNLDYEDILTRVKRQVENFETDDDPSGLSENQEEESGFWDRVVKVALKLFSRFVEWLNS